MKLLMRLFLSSDYACLELLSVIGYRLSVIGYRLSVIGKIVVGRVLCVKHFLIFLFPLTDPGYLITDPG